VSSCIDWRQGAPTAPELVPRHWAHRGLLGCRLHQAAARMPTMIRAALWSCWF